MKQLTLAANEFEQFGKTTPCHALVRVDVAKMRPSSRVGASRFPVKNALGDGHAEIRWRIVPR
jgi:hypothetical protein